MFDSDKLKIFPKGSSNNPKQSSAKISKYRVPPPPQRFTSFWGFRVNIGICKPAGYTYFCVPNEKFVYILPILPKISLSEIRYW